MKATVTRVEEQSAVTPPQCTGDSRLSNLVVSECVTFVRYQVAKAREGGMQ